VGLAAGSRMNHCGFCNASYWLYEVRRFSTETPGRVAGSAAVTIANHGNKGTTTNHGFFLCLLSVCCGSVWCLEEWPEASGFGRLCAAHGFEWHGCRRGCAAPSGKVIGVVSGLWLKEMRSCPGIGGW
jgi:hypothetical protein